MGMGTVSIDWESAVSIEWGDKEDSLSLAKKIEKVDK